jgi:alpha-D-xyloside xylohydrolase
MTQKFWILVAILAMSACGTKAATPDDDAVTVDDVADAAGDVTQTTALPIPDGDLAILTSTKDVAVLRIDRKNLQLTLRRSTDASAPDVQKMDLTRIRIGRVAKWDPEYNYSPENLADQPPDGLTWLHPVSATWTPHVLEGAVTTGVTLLLATQDEAGKAGPDYRLSIEPIASPGFRAHILPADAALADKLAHDQQPTDALVYVGLRAQVPKTERFYGLGEYFDTPQHRGKTRLMQFITLGIDSSNNEAHVPVPLLIGTQGWGLFVQDRHPGLWNVAATQDDEVEALFATHALTFYLFAAQTPLDITGQYTQVTGAPVLPAKWAFGTLIWRNENKDTAEVLGDMQAIRDNDLAISGMWLDRPFDVKVNDFGFDPAKFADPKALVDGVHAKGFRLGEWSTPYTEKGAREHDKVVANGWYVQIADILQALLKWGPPLDLTNPDVMAFWKGQIKLAADNGVEGWKLDYGEDIQVGFLGTRVHSTFFDGSDERTMHHGFEPLYHKPYAENLPATGGWLLDRSGTYGDQIYTSIIWPGDLCANWSRHLQCDKGGSPCHAGGLPASVSASISLPASGYPLFGPDTGGYRHGRAGKELFIRWLQHSSFSGILQIGGGDQHNPWDFSAHSGNPYNLEGTSQFDQEVLDISRYFIRLHTRLFPYIYSYAQNAHDHKPGLTRALGLQFPELNDRADIADFEATEYLFGEDILVAPFTQPGGARKVLIPKGQWLNWWTHEAVGLADAATVIDVTLPVAQSPMYVRSGALIAMLRPTIDTLAPVTEQGIDSFAGNPGRLYVLATPGKPGTRTLYDGTQLATTALTGFDVAKVFGTQKGADFATEVEWQLWLDAKPAPSLQGGGTLTETSDDATWATCSSCWRWDTASKTASVRVAMGAVFTL